MRSLVQRARWLCWRCWPVQLRQWRLNKASSPCSTERPRRLGGMPGGWWVEEGAITSESTKEQPCLKAHYLYWKGGEPADFVLRFQYKLIGGNSGVQIRSQKRPDWDTWGYQADMEAGGQWTGCLFQHDRDGVVMRGKKAVIREDGTRVEEEFASGDELQAKVKPDDWNDYEIVARGSRITLAINGHLMCEVDDRHARLACKGIICANASRPADEGAVSQSADQAARLTREGNLLSLLSAAIFAPRRPPPSTVSVVLRFAGRRAPSGTRPGFPDSQSALRPSGWIRIAGCSLAASGDRVRKIEHLGLSRRKT